MVRGTASMSSTDNMAKLHDLIKSISKLEVYVGVTEEKASRPRGGVNNAELVFIHTNGSPLRGIPARPIIEPAIEKNKDAIAKELQVALKLALEGNLQEAKAQLENVGDFASGEVRMFFDDPDNGWAPNSPYTIKQKGSSMPLVDTSEMRKSITYVVGDKDA